MRLTLLSHVWNEAFLLPHFLRHWRSVVDHGLIFDYNSTDDSAAIIKDMCPTWEVRPSMNESFDAHGCDVEIMQGEREFSGWKYSACVTEMIVHPDLKGYLERFEQEHPDCDAVAMKSFVMVDDPAYYGKMVRDDQLLYVQKHHGFYDEGTRSRAFRYLHRGVCGMYSQVGRHATGLPNHFDPELVHLWWGMSPWPQSKPRKLQIQQRIGQDNRIRGWGHQHIVTEEELDARYADVSRHATDLRENPVFRDAVTAVNAKFRL